MNDTNRALNRIVVFVVGLVLLLAGVAVAVGALWPDVQQTVSDGASDASGQVTDALSGGQVWILWVTAAACLVLALLLVAFIVRQGGGRTSTLIDLSESDGSRSPSGGHVVIDAKVAANVLEEALSGTPGVLAADVVAFRVKGENVLRVTVDARRGASPVELRRAVDEAVSRWDDLLGTVTPVVVQINGGLRTQMSGATRLD
jgi:hypothetical protein